MTFLNRKSPEQQRMEAELTGALADLRAQLAKLDAQIEARSEEAALTRERERLKKQVEDLKLEKDRIVEANEREKREVTHMVGLERKRQEFEAEQAQKDVENARREAMADVREENLLHAREAFEQQMKFQEERFKKEVGYLKDLLGQILERLPTVNVDRKIVDRTNTKTDGS